MSRYFVILFAMLYFTPLSQFCTVDKETCSERWKRFFFTKKMPAHCFKQQCHSTSQKHYCHLLRHSKTISRVIFKWLQRAIKAHADRVLCRTKEKCGNFLQCQQAETSPWAESCAPALPWRKRHGSLCWLASPGGAEEWWLQLLTL